MDDCVRINAFIISEAYVERHSFYVTHDVHVGEVMKYCQDIHKTDKPRYLSFTVNGYGVRNIHPANIKYKDILSPTLKEIGIKNGDTAWAYYDTTDVE